MLNNNFFSSDENVSLGGKDTTASDGGSEKPSTGRLIQVKIVSSN